MIGTEGPPDQILRTLPRPGSLPRRSIGANAIGDLPGHSGFTADQMDVEIDRVLFDDGALEPIDLLALRDSHRVLARPDPKGESAFGIGIDMADEGFPRPVDILAEESAGMSAPHSSR